MLLTTEEDVEVLKKHNPYNAHKLCEVRINKFYIENDIYTKDTIPVFYDFIMRNHNNKLIAIFFSKNSLGIYIQSLHGENSYKSYYMATGMYSAIFEFIREYKKSNQLEFVFN